MGRLWLIALVMLAGGCGVAGSGTATTTAAAPGTQEAMQARQTEERVRHQIGSVYEHAADQRRTAEADGQ